MKGRIIFNGNIQLETEFISRFQHFLLDSQHSDSRVRDSRKTLLITAAWQKRELDEAHVRQALYDIGIVPVYQGEENVQNLSVYHVFNQLRQADTELYQRYHAKQKVLQQVKRFYREKNSGLIRILQNQIALLRESFPQLSLFQILQHNIAAAQPHLSQYNPWQLLYHYACQDIQASMDKIRANDDQMLSVCHEIDDAFNSSGLHQHALYQQMRDELRRRLLSAHAIFIFGGHIAVLANRLNFFQLQETFAEVLERGTDFYTVSAGSLCLCDYLVVFDDASQEWSPDGKMADYELFDKGFGLVTKVQLFPHCRDYIALHDADTIAYTSARFQRSRCVGLDQRSFLLMETYRAEGQEYERFVSAGQDESLYLFEPNGQVSLLSYGQELNLPGTQHWR